MTTTALVVAGFALLLALLGAVLLELRRVRRGAAEPVARLEARVQTLAEQLGARVGESASASRELTSLVGRQLEGAHRAQQQLVERLGRLDEATRQVERVGRSIAGLEQILASPKRRGGLGEWSLELLLAEALPAEHIARQHRLASRDVVVDVAVRGADGRLIAIDSKFPLESYRRLLELETQGAETEAARREFHRAVRGRVDEIARKYISPEDGTLDFALMYVPSEAVYYELAVHDAGGEFAAYCRGRKVHLCSPNTLYVYLHALALGLRGQRMAEDAHAIQAGLEHLRQDVEEVRTYLDRAATQLRNAVQNADAAAAAAARVEGRLQRLAE